MTDWYVDRGLATLIAQEKQLHPGMSIGTIAGGDHVATWPATDHAAEPDGSVDAADFMIGAHFTRADCKTLEAQLVEARDPRFGYWIFERRIISSTTEPWKWREYKGTDPHTGHGHLSVNDKHETDNSPWKLGGKMWAFEKLNDLGLPILHQGDDDIAFDGYNAVGRAQSLINHLIGADLKVDGEYGKKTATAVRELAEKYGKTTNGKTIDQEMWVLLVGLSKVIA